jgi:hypothetical protein
MAIVAYRISIEPLPTPNADQVLPEHKVLRGRRDSAGYAHTKLKVTRRLQNALFYIILRVVEHTGVKNLNFGFNFNLLHHQPQFFQKLRVVFKHGIVLPVHCAAVVGGHFRL